MSAAARRLIPFSFEAKNQERVNVWDAHAQCRSNCGAHAPAVVPQPLSSPLPPWAALPHEEMVPLDDSAAKANFVDLIETKPLPPGAPLPP